MPNLTVPTGTVISQEPNTGTGFRGDQITLQVSWNPFSAQVQVPNVIGMKAEDAKRELESLGFKVAVRGEFDGSREVRDQTPQAGELRPSGSTVRLVLARG